MSLRSIRSKIMALTLIAILATVVIQLITSNISLAKLTTNSQSITQQHVLSEVQAGLKNTVDSMVSSLTDMYKRNAGTIPEDQLVELIRKTLDASRYGDSGYFFAYRYDGVRVVAPENKAQEGQNLWDLTDKSGKKVVQEFIKTAQNGGGFVSYLWLNPKTNKEEEKLSYIAPLKLGNLELAVGTGTYLSMVEVAKNDVAREIAQSRKALSGSLVTISIIVLLILAVITYFFTRTITTPLILA
ncbi:cache domain-containing protein, partial [Neomoorella humiferrea]